jgi:hypothetical protein
MEIKSIYSEEFKKYGVIINDDFSDILEVLKTRECPKDRVIYKASDDKLEACESFKKLQDQYFGSYPTQLGYCSGYNHVNTCLEYHKSSEINLANEPFILLVGERKDVVNGTYDLSKAEAFLVPSGVAIEVFSTTLHYAPISSGESTFIMLVALPRGTNVGNVRSENDKLLWSCNKWLIAHKDSNEAKEGAFAGLIGEMIHL